MRVNAEGDLNGGGKELLPACPGLKEEGKRRKREGCGTVAKTERGVS